MKLTNVFAKSVNTWEKFQQAVSTSGHKLTLDEAKQAAGRFSVPVADVLAFRDGLLGKSNAATETAGQNSKALRDQAGTPIGQAAVTGLGGAMQTRMGAVTVKPLTSVPTFVDTRSAYVMHGVHVGNATSSSATAMLLDAKKNQIHVSIPVQGDPNRLPTIAFVDAANVKSGTITQEEIGPNRAELAANLVAFLDVVLGNSAPANMHGSGANYGSAVLEDLRARCEEIMSDNGAPTPQQEDKLFNDATAAFDKGQWNTGEQMLGVLSTRSADRNVRLDARFVLAEMHFRRGNHDDALHEVKVALPALVGAGRVSGLEMGAKIHNAKRDFQTGADWAQRAVDEGTALQKAGQNLSLSGVHFTLGVAQKNLGKIDEAVASMEAALAARPGATYIHLALAGYLGIAGDKPRANAMFASIPVPPKHEMTFLDYNSNATWFHAVNKDKAKVLEFAEKALEAAEGFNFPGTVNYFKTETDLDWLRGDADFQKLMARFQGASST